MKKLDALQIVLDSMIEQARQDKDAMRVGAFERIRDFLKDNPENYAAMMVAAAASVGLGDERTLMMFLVTVADTAPHIRKARALSEAPAVA